MAFQEAAIRRLFSTLNPGVSQSAIDFSAYIDPSLHMDENIEKLESQYPYYEWRAESRSGWERAREMGSTLERE